MGPSMKNSIKTVRKRGRKDALEENRSLMQIAREASRHAIETGLSAGIPVVYEHDGYLVREMPDKQVIKVRKLQPKKPFDLREYLGKQ